MNRNGYVQNTNVLEKQISFTYGPIKCAQLLFPRMKVEKNANGGKSRQWERFPTVL